MQPIPIFAKTTEHLYVHVPFCNHICTYCDFKRILKTPLTQFIVDDYLIDMQKQLQDHCQPKQFKTIFLGGGTPNCLTNNELTTLLKALAPYAHDECEFSIECNPDLINQEQIDIFKKYKVNRISLGVQSTNNAILKQVNRIHTIEDVSAAIRLLQANQISNISCDFIYNLENMTFQDIDDVFIFLKQHNIPHVSFYALEIKSNSLLKRLGCTIDPDKEADQLEYIEQKFQTAQFHRYEVSNWVIDEKYKCQHNLAYWQTKDWMALGYGAHGFENQYYYQFNGRINQPTLESKRLSDHDYYQQILIMGLRLAEGLDLNNPKYYNAFMYFRDQLDHYDIKDNRLYAKSLDLLNLTILPII
ncbi:radical SAM family heme chaperone HemW [Ureaplasma miroungigenitalium]|uniref:Heme chaperone HemW n=1 Tax=Ureaplasma miroungigenitalium TaxID=1042321 RepID=A0ABT3BNB9_9BACT|nr:radical SAM family heme chaperone HemW [Ureaplasma miroungigenitalium]MCV3728586.1 radical SAM family heme chaperone HemW [Ureaplasma miroungigenitalium]MCV3734407.1 radical SAM family heme chaperone HemW [Ureaplasma miroungigenitalium]